jgi:hypothetical protein
VEIHLDYWIVVVVVVVVAVDVDVDVVVAALVVGVVVVVPENRTKCPLADPETKKRFSG